MKLYRTDRGIYLTVDTPAENTFRLEDTHPNLTWDDLFTHPDLSSLCHSIAAKATPNNSLPQATILAPIGTQEVWAAGVTYFRSRSARIEESQGGGDFYDRVYSADRPELFFKATARRVVGPGQNVRIRSDAHWSVPEPELTLALNPRGQIIAYTIGNDMSSRDIEGENPLYLPQAKLYTGSCALGPCLHLTPSPLPSTTPIRIEIQRAAEIAFTGHTTLAELKRDPQLLADFLFRDNNFPHGAFLMTGTGIVPPDSFTLAPGDRISITIDPIGTLTNTVA